MDLFDGVRSVRLEPITIGIHEDIFNWGADTSIVAKTGHIYIAPLPDDDFQYQLYGFLVGNDKFTTLGGRPGPLDIAGAYALDQSSPTWIFICEKWCQHVEEMIPSHQGALALKYPGAYGLYVYNNSSRDIDISVFIHCYKKHKPGS